MMKTISAILILTFIVTCSGCVFTDMNRSFHKTRGKQPGYLSSYFALTADAVTSPIQAAMLINEGREESSANEDQSEKNQQAELKSTTPAETYIRAYFKPASSETEIDAVQITIQRDGVILKTVELNQRLITDESPAKDYPWEALLPMGEHYAGTEFVNNPEAGSIKFMLNANIKGKGRTVKEINAD